MTATPYTPIANPQVFLLDLFVAVQRTAPLHSMGQHLPPVPKGRTVVLGAGKAGGSMCQALEALWPQEAPLSGLVVTRYHHIPPRSRGWRSVSNSLRPLTPCRMPPACWLPSACWR